MDNEIFAARLKQLRKEKGITQKQLAEELKISLPSIVHYENAHRSPVSGVLTLMQQYFDVSEDYLLGETDERRPAQKWDDPELVQAVSDNLSSLFDEEQKLIFDVLVELRHTLKLKDRTQRREALRLFHDTAPAVLHWPEKNRSGAEEQE